MKKKVFSLMMLFMALFGFARANELTVYEGTTTNNYVPAYVFYFDDFTKSQYVIPAADLAAMDGADIQSITWYTTSSYIPYTSVSTVDVYVTEVASASISAFVAKADCQIVYNGTLDFVTEGAGGKCVVTFSTPYHYNGGNLLIGCENITDAGYKNIYFYGQTVSEASVAGYNSSSLDGVTPIQRNFIPKTTFTYGGGGGGGVGADQLHVKYMDGDEVVVDRLNLGVRPAGAWMEPFNFTMYTEGTAYTVNVLDFTPSDGMFTVAGEELPFQVVRDEDVALNMVTNGTEAGVIERQFVAITEGDRAAHIWPVTVELYTPEVPDVWEKACEEATTFPFVEVPANAHHTVLHDDYTLPFPEIEEGVDAVYKLVFTQDQMLNAEVTRGANGKVALYTEDFNGEGGPMATNYYNGTEIMSGGGAAAPFEAMIGDETSTTYTAYMPFYTLYNYSISEALFTAAELAEAGVTTAPMGSLSWEAIDVTTTQAQNNISIWMANVTNTEVEATSVLASGMTLVYTGSIPTVPPMGWNEFVFNQGSFAWDGVSNVLILVQRNNGQWSGHVNWRSHNPGFAGMAYKYQDSTPYDAAAQTYDLTVSSTSRPNTLFKSAGRRTLPMLSTLTRNPGVNTNASLNRDGWMYYDDGTYATNVGAGGDVYWGTMFPASMITEDRLTKVALYENDENVGNITLTVYSGGTTAPGTQIYTQNITPVGGDAFHEITLASPVTIDPSQNLWIVFHQAGDAYPACACAGSSYPNNRWVSLDGIQWLDLAEAGLPGYEWMIRAYLANNAPVPPTPPTPTPGEVSYSAGPVIEGLPVTPGTYYLVASSTTPDFEVTINAEDMPCPTVEEFAFSPMPADNEDGVDPASVTLRWMIPEYATSWRLVFGSTYHPEEGHPQTIITDWSNSMANSYTVRNLWNNTNYFWRVEFKNDGCPEGASSPIWGFTTHLNVPQGLTVVDETVFNDEQIVLNWNAVVDRTYRMYNVYRDGEFIGHTNVNNIGNTTYTDGPLPYNMDGYHYYVTAVYDEGESAPSNEVIVKVSGYGDVNGHVYEQDGTTGIAGATVTMVGQDEFGVSHTYNFQTNADGYYTGHIYAGAAYDGQAAKEGYQTANAPVQGEPIVVNYNETASPYDYILDENFDPVCSVIAEYYPDSLDPTSPFVKVYWGCGLPGEEIVEPFETGDFSMFDWQLDNSYPWSITTTNPYEGTYCMKSGGAGVPSVVSNMTVTVNIPADGVMSYFGKISCESNWDYGYFYIDGVQKAQYTGVSNWAEKSFDITAGDHTFMWQYTKDASVNSNDDCFYVDFITFYKRPEPPQPAEPGWHTYAEGDFNNAVGSNVGTSRWAYEYPVSLLGSYAGFNMTKVSLFSDNMYSAVGGNYTCTIYQGGDEPMAGTAVSTITVDVPANMNAWVDFDLTTPVSVTGNAKLWVVWTANSPLSSWPAGCCDGLVEEGTWWSAGVEAGYGWEHETYGTWTMRQYFTNREGRGFYSYASDNAPVAVEVPEVVKGAPAMPVKGVETVTTTCANPNAAPSARVINRNTRSLDHYRVYRTNCYNDGPYTEENTVLLATVWVPDTVYIDVEWADLPAGVYKWGVGSVYSGNRGEEIAGPIHWSEPVNVNNADRATLTYDFDNSTMQGWTTIDANNDGYDWVLGSQIGGVYLVDGASLAGSGHNESNDLMCSGSYSNVTGAITPDNYLVSPQVALGGSISFWACAQDAGYAGEHFAVAVSTSGNTNASDFTNVQEWTMTAKGASSVMSYGRDGSNRAQGSWYQYTVDLSAYSGMGYVAIRHFNCNDQFILNVDDITIVEGAGGPTPPTPPTPGTGGLQLPRESEIVWSNCLDKDMYLGENEVDINVLLNSADSPEGIEVSFVNLNEAEQELYPIDNIVLDETGFYAWDTFRKGDYQLTITREGYETITENVSIWEPTSLRYVMIEIIYGVDNLYVSRTGWAMWEGHGDPGTPGPGPGPQPGPGDTFSVNFDDGQIPAGWTTIDANNDGYNWVLGSQIGGIYLVSGASLEGSGHNSSTDLICSGSYSNATNQAITPDNYLVSPQVNLAAGSTFSFWACAQDAGYAAEHFGVFVSDNGTSDWTSVQEWTMTAKSGGAMSIGRGGQTRAQGNWYNYSVDLSAFAGQKYIAIRHFNCNDQFILDVDDIELTSGAKSNDRHLEYYKVMCESIDHEPIFNINTPYNFCQVATDQLVEGEQYICKVAAVYSTGMSPYAECVWEYESCENYAGTVNGLNVNGTTVTWDYPGTPGPGPQPGTGDSFNENFDAGMPAGWTTVDADGDGFTWVSSMTPGNYHNAGVDLTGTGHNSSAHYVISGSWANGLGQVLYPDNYLVSPQVNLVAGSTFSFWACAQDAGYPADHFGVFISDNGTSDWTMVNEWTMTAKGGGNVTSYGRGGATRAQGNWYNYTVDLSAFAGQKYIAIRHFNCSDQFIINVDDIELTSGAKSNRAEWTFQNGFVTDPGAMANGGDASWIKGSQSTYGPGCQQTSSNWVADSFTLDAATTIDQIQVYGYQTGSTTTSTFTGLYVQIYNGNPMNGGSVVWGDANTNIMTATAFTNCYRGSDGDATGTTRPIMSITAGGLNIELGAGTYYLAYQLTGTGSSGPWGQPHAEPGIGNTGNGVQYLGSSSAWQALTDTGAGTSYGCAMTLHGTTGAPAPGPTPSGDILGAMVFLNGEWEAFVAAPTNSYEFPSAGEYCVRIVYNGANELPSNNFFYAMSCEECEGDVPPTCEPGDPIHAEVLGATDQVRIWWGVEPAAPIEEWLYYDDGEMAGALGAGGAIYWAIMFPASSLQAYAGTSLTQVAVMEYDSPGNYTANIYLGGTSAPATLVSTQEFSATGTVDWKYVTLDTPVAIDGTQNLWITMYQAGITYPATACVNTGDPNGRWVSTNGTQWIDVTTAGDFNYTWLIRGFVTNQAKGGQNTELPEFHGEVGGELSSVQVTPVAPAFAPMNRANIVKYNVYRSNEATGNYVQIGEVAEAGQTLYEYFDTPDVAGMYYYQVTAVYDDGCESAPALAADDPTHNYVSASVDAIGENSDNVALYPNPTKGNVTIEANGMSRITVVSVLGQVVYDTELNADVYTLNMSQFNAGMYMVRIHTENGVTVKRVTVMQ